MKNSHKAFLVAVYVIGLVIRLYPRLEIDPHLLTFQGDIWYRLAMSQYIVDNLALPNPDLRYLAYGEVPMWYPPLSPLFLASLSFLTGIDLPTVSSRIIPFVEALTPIPIFFLAGPGFPIPSHSPSFLFPSISCCGSGIMRCQTEKTLSYSAFFWP
jgi:hypothetical protein